MEIRQNLTEVLLKLIQSDSKPLLIWGACKKTDIFVTEFLANNVNFYGYIDANAEIIKTYNGYPVYDKEIIKSGKFFVYVGLDDDYADILDFLYQSNYCEFIDFWYPNRHIHISGSSNYVDPYGNMYKNIFLNGEGYEYNVILSGGSKIIIENKCIIEKTVRIEAHNKSEIIVSEGCEIENNCVILAYNYSKVQLNNNISLKHDSLIRATANSSISLGERCFIEEYASIRAADYSVIKFGKMSTSGAYLWCVSTMESTISIGEGCMFSSWIAIQAGNGHNLFDIVNMVNLDNIHCRDITIDDHVWIGLRCVIFSGSIIGAGSMIGANSFVNKQFPINSCIAGSPATIKKNISWQRTGFPLYTTYENFTEFDFTNKK